MTNDIPTCDVTGDAMDECDHVAVDDYDEIEEADARLAVEREGGW